MRFGIAAHAPHNKHLTAPMHFPILRQHGQAATHNFSLSPHPATAGQSRNQFLGPAAAIRKAKIKKDAHADTKSTKKTRLRESFVLFMPSW
jgi:hypothetical protein